MKPKIPAIMKIGFVGLLLAFFISQGGLNPPLKDPGQAPIDPALLTGEFDTNQIVGEFQGQTFASKLLVEKPTSKQVLGSNDDTKRIEVDLTNQHLYAFEGDRQVYDFPVSTGKWGRTPTGTFRIWGKFRYTKMSGGNPALNTYYYLPNVPYVMFYENSEVAASRGFSLHGTYWHNNFGHPMSHGCVNLRTEDAGKLFYWTSPNVGDKKTVRSSNEDQGTTIIVYGTTPRS